MDNQKLKEIINSDYETYTDEEKMLYLLMRYDYLAANGVNQTSDAKKTLEEIRKLESQKILNFKTNDDL